MKIKTIVEQEVTPPVYLDYDGEFDCIKSTDDMLSVNPGKLITRAEYIARVVQENTGQPLTAQDLDDLRALIEPQQAFKVGDQVVLEDFEGKSSYWTLDLIHYHGTIAKVCEVFDQHYGVTLHDNTTAMWHPSGMKPWTPRPPKVGDLVRTDDFKDGTEGMGRHRFVDKFSGKTGIVDRIGPSGKPEVHGWYWPISAVTIVKPTP